MKVRVKTSLPENFVGFYEHVRRRPGDVFTLEFTKRRGLFPAEKAMIDRDADAGAIYKQIADKDGKVPSPFSFRWMEPVAENTPDRITTAQQRVDQASQTIREERAATRQAEGEASNVI